MIRCYDARGGIQVLLMDPRLANRLATQARVIPNGGAEVDFEKPTRPLALDKIKDRLGINLAYEDVSAGGPIFVFVKAC